MISHRFAVVIPIVALLLISAAPSLAGNAISIRNQKGGKVLLVVDDESVRTEAGGKPLLVIDGPNILKEKGGQRLFFIDGDLLHAYVPEGTVVQYIDGRQLKTGPGGKETVYIDGAIIRKPNRAGAETYWIDANEVMNNQQLMAVIYTLNPELFAMPKAPAAAAEKPADATPSAPGAPSAHAASAAPTAPVAPSAPSAATTSNEFAGGTYSIAYYKSSDGAKHAGNVTIKKQGAIYAMELNFTDGTPMQGVAVWENGELWAAVGPANTVGLAVYKTDGDAMNGTWLNITGDSSKFGSENLDGGKTLVGKHNITAAKAPFTGAAYAGGVMIDEVDKAKLGGDAKPVTFAWDLGGYKAQGVGFQVGTTTVAAVSTGADCSIVRFKSDPANGSTLVGYFHAVSKATGTYKLTHTGD